MDVNIKPEMENLELNVHTRDVPWPDRDQRLAASVTRMAPEPEHSQFYQLFCHSKSSSDEDEDEDFNGSKTANHNVCIDNNTNGMAEISAIAIQDESPDEQMNVILPAGGADTNVGTVAELGADIAAVAAPSITTDNADKAVTANGDDILRDLTYRWEGSFHHMCGCEHQSKRNYEDAKKEWKIAGAYGYMHAYYRLGKCYGRGEFKDGVNLDKALKCFKKVANEKNPNALYYYAHLSIKLHHPDPFNITEKDSKFIKDLKRAADLGVIPALIQLGEIYMEFDDPDLHQKAVKQFSKASEHRHHLAEYYLGLCYEKGRGVPQNYDIARRFYMKASCANIAEAQHNLAVFYEHGIGGLAVDREEAIRWYQEAAKGGLEISAADAIRLRQAIDGPALTVEAEVASDEMQVWRNHAGPTVVHHVDPVQMQTGDQE